MKILWDHGMQNSDILEVKGQGDLTSTGFKYKDQKPKLVEISHNLVKESKLYHVKWDKDDFQYIFS